MIMVVFSLLLLLHAKVFSSTRPSNILRLAPLPNTRIKVLGLRSNGPGTLKLLLAKLRDFKPGAVLFAVVCLLARYSKCTPTRNCLETRFYITY